MSPASTSTLVVEPAAGARSSNVPPRLVLKTTPALDGTTISGTAPLTVELNLCNSSDPDAGDSLNWQFHFGDSGSSPFAPDGAFMPDFDHFCRASHTYRAGDWTATVSVTDKHLEDQARTGEPRALARTTTQIRIVANGTESPAPSAPAPGGPAPTFRYIFLTNGDFDGGLGGLTGADSKCQAAARAVGIPNADSFMAWLSDTTGSPSTRFIRSTVPYRNVRFGVSPPEPGAIVADDWNDLTDGTLDAMIATQFGGTSPLSLSWSNTTTDGRLRASRADLHCGDWRDAIGTLTGNLGEVSVTARWTDLGAQTSNCMGRNHLICVQQ